MKAIIRLFYLSLLWATTFELAVAKAAPDRNHDHIDALQRDADEYERALLRLEMGI